VSISLNKGKIYMLTVVKGRKKMAVSSYERQGKGESEKKTCTLYPHHRGSVPEKNQFLSQEGGSGVFESPGAGGRGK